MRRRRRMEHMCILCEEKWSGRIDSLSGSSLFQLHYLLFGCPAPDWARWWGKKPKSSGMATWPSAVPWRRWKVATSLRRLNRQRKDRVCLLLRLFVASAEPKRPERIGPFSLFLSLASLVILCLCNERMKILLELLSRDFATIFW